MKRFLFIICIISIFSFSIHVSAKDVQVFFITEGGSTNTSGFKIIDDYVNKTDGTYCATYKSNGTIKTLNSINGASFSIYKSGTNLVSGREWYTYNYSNNKLYYFNQSKSYNIDEVLQKLSMSGDSYPVISLFAHWNGDGVDGGTDMVGTSNSSTNIAKVKAISISGSNKISKGKSTTLKVTYKPSNAKKETITWSSSNKKIASVNSSGKVTGISKGTVTITAKTSSGKSATFKVAIVDNVVHKVKISFHMNGGKFIVSPSASLSSSGNSVVWKKNNFKFVQEILYGEKTGSSGLPNYNNFNCINVVKDGYVAKEGAEWNTKTDGSGKSYSDKKVYKASDFCDAKDKDCSVTLYVNWTKDASSNLKLDKEVVNISKGNSVQVVANKKTTLVWSVLDPKIAKVNNGKITGLSEGTTIVYVKEKENSHNLKKVYVNVSDDVTKKITSSKIAHFYFLDVVPNSDSFVVESNGHYGLIDMGFDPNRKDIVKKIRKTGAKKLDFVILTHAHADHMGCYREVFDNFKIGKLYMHNVLKDENYVKLHGKETNEVSKNYRNVINYANNKGISICDAKEAVCQKFQLGDINFKLYNTDFHDPKVLLSHDDYLKHFARFENANSVTAVANIYGRRVYFAGDIGDYFSQKSESIASKQVGDIDVYKASHHGYSVYNNNQKSLNYLKAEYAIITYKKTINTTEVLKRLRKANKNYKKEYFISNGKITLKIDSNGKMTFSQD